MADTLLALFHFKYLFDYIIGEHVAQTDKIAKKLMFSVAQYSIKNTPILYKCLAFPANGKQYELWNIINFSHIQTRCIYVEMRSDLDSGTAKDQARVLWVCNLALYL